MSQLTAMLSEKNVGLIDRIMRISLGLVLLSFVFVGPQTPWALIGIAPLVTGILGKCPAYSIFGIKTC